MSRTNRQFFSERFPKPRHTLIFLGHLASYTVKMSPKVVFDGNLKHAPHPDAADRGGAVASVCGHVRKIGRGRPGKLYWDDELSPNVDACPMCQYIEGNGDVDPAPLGAEMRGGREVVVDWEACPACGVEPAPASTAHPLWNKHVHTCPAAVEWVESEE